MREGEKKIVVETSEVIGGFSLNNKTKKNMKRFYNKNKAPLVTHQIWYNRFAFVPQISIPGEPKNCRICNARLYLFFWFNCASI